MKYLKQIVSIGLSFAICVLTTVPTMGQSVTSIRHNIERNSSKVQKRAPRSLSLKSSMTMS